MDLHALLPGFNGIRCERTFPNEIVRRSVYETTTFVRNDITVLSSHLGINEVGGSLAVELERENEKYLVYNLHGPVSPTDKKTTLQRENFSCSIINFAQQADSPAIIMGDLNMDLEEKCVTLFEDFGYRNLIRDYHIATTRPTSAAIAAKERMEAIGRLHEYFGPQPYADYVFVSSGVEVGDFRVFSDTEASDHYALGLVTAQP